MIAHFFSAEIMRSRQGYPSFILLFHFISLLQFAPQQWQQAHQGDELWIVHGQQWRDALQRVLDGDSAGVGAHFCPVLLSKLAVSISTWLCVILPGTQEKLSQQNNTAMRLLGCLAVLVHPHSAARKALLVITTPKCQWDYFHDEVHSEWRHCSFAVSQVSPGKHRTGGNAREGVCPAVHSCNQKPKLAGGPSNCICSACK